MRGKAAAQSANRRTRIERERVRELELELTRLRAQSRDEINELRRQLAKSRTEQMRVAGELAHRSVERERQLTAAAQHKQALSDDIGAAFMTSKDRLIMNACRYISMTKGFRPLEALELVTTWCTDKDCYGYSKSRVDILVELGVGPDSWTSWQLSRLNKHLERRLARRRRQHEHPRAWALDHAEANPEDFEIHPDYKPSWYPKARHGGIELVDEPSDEGTDEQETA